MANKDWVKLDSNLRSVTLIPAILIIVFSGAITILEPAVAVPTQRVGDTPKKVIIIVSDLGIEQWKPGLVMFDDFGKLQNKALQPLPNGAQILLPMPADSELPTTKEGWQNLQAQISVGLNQRIQSAIEDGNSTIEIRFVENMKAAGYLTDAGRQENIESFVSSGLAALNDAKGSLEAAGMDVSVPAVGGSNGGRTLVDVLPTLDAAGENPIGQMSLVSSRGSLDNTLATSRILDDRLQVLVNETDFPGINIVGDFGPAEKLKAEEPGVRVLFVSPELSPLQSFNPFASHIEQLKTGRPPSVYCEYNGQYCEPSQPLDYQKIFTDPLRLSTPEWNIDFNSSISENFLGIQHLGPPPNQAKVSDSSTGSTPSTDIFDIAPDHPSMIDPSVSLSQLRQALLNLKRQQSSSEEQLQRAEMEFQLEQQKDQTAQSGAQGLPIQITIPIPPGWVPCQCPNQHPGAGIFVNGVQYHTPLLHCQ